MACANVDITKAVILVSVEADAVERQAALMLRQEVQKRTGVVWPEVLAVPEGEQPVVVLGSRAHLPVLPAGLTAPPGPEQDGQPAAEGYVLAVNGSAPAPVVWALGNDRRGVLFAVGRLLRELRWGEGQAALPAGLSISTAPAYPMRGIQLGYRRLNDTLDAWDVSRFTQYFRDLIMFGNNAIELIPPVTPGNVGLAEMDPLMPMTPWDLTIALCGVLDAYDMDVWFWLPLEKWATLDEEHRQRSLRERDLLFGACSRIDAIFVPGGDPGDTPPQLLMPYLKDLTEVLHRHHPNAQMWVSPQKFEGEELAWFYQYLQNEQPAWLAGLVWGPGCLTPLSETRALTPEKYPVRHYPDVTHAHVCQFPFPYWDQVWSLAYERQPIHPRPTQYAYITNYHLPYTPGAIAYSDGTGDDVNKIVMLQRHWDPEADVRQTLVEYGRCFVGSDLAEGVADGILLLEKNWTEPATTSPQVPQTLAQWQALENQAGPKQLGSWRFQQGLIRAYADAYVQQRAQQEEAVLSRAYAALGGTGTVAERMAAAERELAGANLLTAAPELRQRTHELAGDLFRSIGMQLSIQQYGASARDRGAQLDNNDGPLTDCAWLPGELARIRLLDSPTAQEAALDRLVHWTDPGPGGFYDDMGNGANHADPHLVRDLKWADDPSFLRAPQDSHYFPRFPELYRRSWGYQAHVYRSPLKMRYEGLDPQAQYLFRAVYAGRGGMSLQLTLGDQPVGDRVTFRGPEVHLREFDVPAGAIKPDGTLDVRWDDKDGYDAQIAEVWLIKK